MNSASKLPLIVGFGGFNAAGRSSGHQAYMRMIYESLGVEQQGHLTNSLKNLMGLAGKDEPGAEPGSAALQGTLVRAIEAAHFDIGKTPTVKRLTLKATDSHALSFTLARRDLPQTLPPTWRIEPLDEGAKYCRVEVLSDQEIKLDDFENMPVSTAGQLPSGFNPANYYRSLHHPRGLQMAILGASDAVKSMGLSWEDVVARVSPDDICVHSASIMSQLDNTGFGGLFKGRSHGVRVTSKQLALGLNTMPADFINAYVLGNLGSTGAMAGACATFLYNLRQGVEEIRSGRKKVAVIGASEAPILPEIIDGYAAMSALATDADLKNLDRSAQADHRRASRPFGLNCGFTLAESSQYVVLMADDLAVELGAKIYGAVPGVYVNADGYKKSISAPGPGNYITVAKAVALARNLLGEDAVRHRSLMQAHGSSTPQNRVSESRIFDVVARSFNINKWPVCAVKSYVGHSLAAASGDQLAVSLGIFAHGIVPGIKTIDAVADDVFADRLHISTKDNNLGAGQTDVIFLNSKGFGGNNATATVFSPAVVKNYLVKRFGESAYTSYQSRLENTEAKLHSYLSLADQGELNPIYEFGSRLVDEEKIVLHRDSIEIPGYQHAISLQQTEGFEGF